MSRRKRVTGIKPFQKPIRVHKKFRRPNRKKGSWRQTKSSPSTLETDLLALLHQRGEPLSVPELMEGLVLDRFQRKILQNTISTLCRRQIIARLPGKRYEIRSSVNLVEGTIDMHPRGFGFAVIQDENRSIAKNNRQDLFISPRNLGTAHHGDLVLLKLIGRRRGRMEARVVRVLERAATILAGVFKAGRDTGLVVPEDDRYTFNILIHKKNSCGAKNGNAVLVEIIDFIPGQLNPEGRITNVLGDPDDVGVQTRMVIQKYALPCEFDEKILKYVDDLPAEIVHDPDRADLREICHVTIDGETARDFDDAVALIKTADSYRLYVSIADVGHYVPGGSALDLEAYQRGTSVYFPGMAVPMLPPRLSDDLCSLVPNQDRLSFTVILDFDQTGTRFRKTFIKSIIKSRYRLTYSLAKHLISGPRDKKLQQEYKPVLAALTWMAELAAKLEAQRMARGSIGFSIPEASLVIDSQGEISAVTRAERNVAHKLIEEFMLAANEAVAETFAQHHLPAIYRIHEKPDPLKVEEFIKFSQTLGLTLPNHSGTPEWFGKVLAMVAGTPKEYIVNNLLLRTMQRACYSPHNVGHFGLAATHYTHFTSPIRRYPDLMAHRLLAAIVKRQNATRPDREDEQELSPAPLDEAGDFLSGRERNATEAEWEMIDRLKARFMADKVGQTFKGIVSGVTAFGLFVELLDWFVSGAVAMTDMKDDHYIYDEKNHRLIGNRTGRIFQLGYLVEVKLTSVEVRQRRINFATIT